MKPLNRLLEDKIVKSLQTFPAVYIAGPRQSGKTTLAKHIASNRHKAHYISFDDMQLKSAASRDPDAFLRAFEGAVVLDEVQLVPEIFRPLKVIIDENRVKRDGGKGKFLLTGSASIMALPRLSDALVGRMALHTLLPFSSREILPAKASRLDFISRVFLEEPHYQKLTDTAMSPNMLAAASYPELLHLEARALRREWCANYINTLLQRDVKALIEIDKVAILPDMLQLFASRTGGVLNEAALSRVTQLNHITTKKYRILLESLFLLFSVPAWTVNFGKRLTKSPKVYLSDINLLLHLLDINDVSIDKRLTYTTSNTPLGGQVLENFVAIELTKQLTFSSVHARLYHYRTADGQEVDFILEGPGRKLIAIEVKSTSKVSERDFKAIIALQKALPERFHAGFVIHQGGEVVPFGKQLYALPLQCLWQGM